MYIVSMPGSIRRFLLYWAAFLLSSGSFAQPPAYQSFCSDFNFPYQQINFALTDAEGYCWFAGNNGLHRWDSKKIVTYGIEDGLPSEELHYLFEDSRKRIWIIANSDDLCYYYNGKIYTPKNDKRLARLHVYFGSGMIEYKGYLYYTDKELHNCKVDLDLSKAVPSHVRNRDILYSRDSLMELGAPARGIAVLRPADSSLGFDQIHLQKPDYHTWAGIRQLSQLYTIYYGLDSLLFTGRYQSKDLKHIYYNKGNPVEVYENVLFLPRSAQWITFGDKIENVFCLNPGFL